MSPTRPSIRAGLVEHAREIAIARLSLRGPPLGSNVRLSQRLAVVVAVLVGACADAGALSPTEDSDAPAPGDTDTASGVERETCTPRLLGWAARNEPAIAYLAGGGIAWHPLTGLRTWGGYPPEGDDTGIHWAIVGFAWAPWDIPAERWRKAFHSTDAPCLMRRDGTVACRRPVNRMPERVAAIDMFDNAVCWMGVTGKPDCSRRGPETGWPSRSDIPSDLVDVVTGTEGARGGPSPERFTCALDVRGRAWCEGPSVVDVFDDPDRCWVELGAKNASICGIDSDGEVVCRSASSPYDWKVTDDVPTRRDLSHLAVSLMGACALDAAGRIVCWGMQEELTNSLSTEPGFVDVAVDSGVSVCALDSVGRTHCWGLTPMATEHPDRAP